MNLDFFDLLLATRDFYLQEFGVVPTRVVIGGRMLIPFGKSGCVELSREDGCVLGMKIEIDAKNQLRLEFTDFKEPEA